MARNECSAIVMNTSIGSDGERSECGSPDSVSPPVTPASLMEKRYDSLMASAAAAASRKFAQNLKFSIENILRPDFGHQTNSSSSKLQCSASVSRPASSSTGSNASSSGSSSNVQNPNMLWPAWVYCTRYSDRPSSGPRCRRVKRKAKAEEKRPRTAFTAEQLARLKKEFQENRYLTEKRRNELANELGLNESQIKIWFQNKRAKIKKQSGNRNALAYHLLAQGLYNHATVPVISRSPSTDDEDMKLDDDDLDDDDELTN